MGHTDEKMKSDEEAYAPPPCSVFVIGKRKSIKKIRFKQVNNNFTQKMYDMKEEDKYYDNKEWIQDKNEIQKIDWKEFLEELNHFKFQPGEWTKRWLDSIDAKNGLGNFEAMKDEGMKPFEHSDSEDSTTSEVVWEGLWGIKYHEKLNKTELSSNVPWKNLANDTAIKEANCDDNNDNTAKGSHDSIRTSGIGSSEVKNDSTTMENYAIVEEQTSEFNVEEIFANSNDKLLVKVCCENYIDKGIKDRVKIRHLCLSQKIVSQKD